MDDFRARMGIVERYKHNIIPIRLYMNIEYKHTEYKHTLIEEDRNTTEK